MKRTGLLLVLLFGLGTLYAQKYDLIVTNSGDSIACQIDSVTDTHICFEMKVHGSWVHTNVEKANVITYQYDTVDRKLFVFKEGTSTIESPKQSFPDTVTFRDIRKNSVYIENLAFLPVLYYNRIFPVDNRAGIVVKTGLSHYDGIILVVEASVLFGGPRHFVEAGLGFWGFESFDDLLGTLGYRYIGNKGLLIIAGLAYTPDFVSPGIGIGFAF